MHRRMRCVEWSWCHLRVRCAYPRRRLHCDGNVLDYAVCGGSGIAEGECDCDGNVLDACGVCGGTGVLGCTDEGASNYNDLACADDGSCLYATTFQVDMSCAYNAGAMNQVRQKEASARCSSPTFTDGAATASPCSMRTATKSGLARLISLREREYKYIVDDWADQENLIDDMQNGAECAPVTDSAGYANRLLAARVQLQRHLRQLHQPQRSDCLRLHGRQRQQL